MDLRTWVLDDHANVLTRLDRGVLSLVPRERWTEHADGGGSSIAWLLFHAAYHQDAAAALVADRDLLLGSRRDALGLGAVPGVAGIGEAEVAAVVEALDVHELERYVRDVHASTAAWLAVTDVDRYDVVPDASAHLAHRVGIPEADAPWLHQMWSGKPVGWFVQWECIGHGHTHTGEAVSVRNRLGLSPF
jgi:hypothetical protein